MEKQSSRSLKSENQKGGEEKEKSFFKTREKEPWGFCSSIENQLNHDPLASRLLGEKK